jgi:hypothetical protein
MKKERLLLTSDDWERFFRERKRADNAITTREYLTFIAIWVVLMLAAHLHGLW